MPQQPQAYSVSAITRMIKTRLEEGLSNVWVEGEISGYLHHTSGHRYLNLKDDRAVLKVTIWRSVGAALKFEPENGQKVLVFGDITVYERGGQYQLNCKRIQPVGVGELELAFRQLHEKLAAEGLFDDSRKKPLPPFPQKIGIVTSPTGAAVRDIIQIARRRNDAVQLIVYPAQVQGEGAELTIAAGLRYFNMRNDIDLIITGRGGGSLEDLWAFNTETTVRAIAASRIPVISAVGHEIDLTLADLAADLRAPTPSAAAELAVWSRQEFEQRLDSLVYSQARYLENLVDTARQQLRYLVRRPVFVRPSDLVEPYHTELGHAYHLMQRAGKSCFERLSNRLSLRASKLDGLSPLKTLARGYSVTRSADSSHLVRSVDDLKVGDRIETILPDGRAVSVVEERTKRTSPE
ncbi:MAG: exodeoxyribonuclease VII large subunit [candidate division Zixibacteria bacterium]|nr:exodeoxyribonuclease VII large subunit [candidate division Zixibacteria bacterium]